jgi:hypothetical protein
MGARSAFSFAPGLPLESNFLSQTCILPFNHYRHFADQGKP